MSEKFDHHLKGHICNKDWLNGENSNTFVFNCKNMFNADEVSTNFSFTHISKASILWDTGQDLHCLGTYSKKNKNKMYIIT